MRIQRLSWAGIKVEVGSTTLFVDAIKLEPNHIQLESATPNCNAVVTHHHSDHYDAKALATVFNGTSLLLCQEATEPWLASSGGLRIQTVALYQPLPLPRGTGEIVVTAVPAVDGFGHPQVSWVIDGAGRRIIHCGDTLWHGHWWDIGRAYGPFDMAFLPINGARQVTGRFTDSGFPMVLTPEQAVSAGRILGAKQICPIHYGGHEPPIYLEVQEPEETFLALADESGMPVRVLSPGEVIDL